MKLNIIFDYYTVARFDLRYFTRYHNLLDFNDLFYQFLWENEFFYRFEALNYNYVFNPLFCNYFICFDFVLRFKIQTKISDYTSFFPYSVYRALGHRKDFLFSFFDSYKGSLINLKSGFYNNIKLGHFVTNNDYFPSTYNHTLFNNLFNINFELSDLAIEFNFDYNIFHRKTQQAPYSVDVSISSFYAYWSSMEHHRAFGFRSKTSLSPNNLILVNTFLPSYCYHIDHHFGTSHIKSTWLYFYFYFYQYYPSLNFYLGSCVLKAIYTSDIIVVSPLINFINIYFNYSFINLFFYKFIFLYSHLMFLFNSVNLNFLNIFLKANTFNFIFDNFLNKFNSITFYFSLFFKKINLFIQPLSSNLNLIKNIYLLKNPKDKSYPFNLNLVKNKFFKQFANSFFLTKYKLNYSFNIKSTFGLTYINFYSSQSKFNYTISSKFILQDIPYNVYSNISEDSLILSKISYIYIKSLKNLNLFFKKFKFISFIIRLSFSKIFLKSSFLVKNKFKFIKDFVFLYFKLFYFFSLSYININFLKYSKYVLKEYYLFNNFYFLFNLLFIKLKLIFYISLSSLYKSFISSRNLKSPFDNYFLKNNNSKFFFNELNFVNIYLSTFFVNNYIKKLIFFNNKQRDKYKKTLFNTNNKKLISLYFKKIVYLYEEQLFNLSYKGLIYIYKHIMQLLYGKVANILFFKNVKNVYILILNDLKRAFGYFISFTDSIVLKNKIYISFRLILLILKSFLNDSKKPIDILKLKLSIFNILKELLFSFSCFKYPLIYLKSILFLINLFIILLKNNKKSILFINKFPNYFIFFEHPILNFNSHLNFVRNFLDNTFFNSFNFINNFFIQKINKKINNKINNKNINKFPIFFSKKIKKYYNPLSIKVQKYLKKIINIGVDLLFFNSIIITLINKFLFEVDYLSFLIFNDSRFSFLFLGYNTYLNFFNKKFKYFNNSKIFIKIFSFNFFELFYIKKFISLIYFFFCKSYYCLFFILELKNKLNIILNIIFNKNYLFFNSLNFINNFKFFKKFKIKSRSLVLKNFYIIVKPFFLKNPLAIVNTNKTINLKFLNIYKSMQSNKKIKNFYKKNIGRVPFLFLNLKKAFFIHKYWFKLLFTYVNNINYSSFYNFYINFWDHCDYLFFATYKINSLKIFFKKLFKKLSTNIYINLAYKSYWCLIYYGFNS